VAKIAVMEEACEIHDGERMCRNCSHSHPDSLGVFVVCRVEKDGKVRVKHVDLLADMYDKKKMARFRRRVERGCKDFDPMG